MEPFEMTVGSVAAAGGELGTIAGTVTATTAGAALSTAALTPVFGVVGGDYLGELLNAVAATDGELVRLAAFFASTSASTAQTVAATLATEAGATTSLLGLLGQA